MALGLAAAASPGPGYLPVAGPAPLRFFAAHWPCTNRFVLTVPAPAPEPASVVSQAAKSAPPRPLTPASTALGPPAVIPQADGGKAPAPVESIPPDGVVSPQMFLKYFTKPANSAAAAAGPLDFTPPKIAPPNSSSATYSTGP